MEETKKTASKNSENKENKKETKEKVDETAKLKSELIDAQKLADDFKDKWMRNVAEFDNYKKRNASLYQDAFTDGVTSVIGKILVIGDSLDWALTCGLDEKTAEGIVNLRKKYDDVLKSLDIVEVNPVGETFDPNLAEAVMQVDPLDGEKSETIKQVLQKGYKYKDKMIRYAKVSVIK